MAATLARGVSRVEDLSAFLVASPGGCCYPIGAMTTSWTLVIAAPLARVAASVEPLAVKPPLRALGEDAVVALVVTAADTPGALAFELRVLLGEVVDSVGPEGLRALESLDGVSDLERARKAPGVYVAAPPVATFAAAAALFGASPPPEGAALKGADALAAHLSEALDARQDTVTLERKLRASRGVADWSAVFGVTASPETQGGEPAAREVPPEGTDEGEARDAMRDALRGQISEAPADKAAPTLEKSDRRRALEDLLKGGGETEDPKSEASATPEGKIGEP